MGRLEAGRGGGEMGKVSVLGAKDLKVVCCKCGFVSTEVVNASFDGDLLFHA